MPLDHMLILSGGILVILCVFGWRATAGLTRVQEVRGAYLTRERRDVLPLRACGQASVTRR